MIQPKYAWVLALPGLPKMVQRALLIANMDTKEQAGSKSNPVIMQLAKDAGVASIYTGDEMPWCAVAHSAIALKSGKALPFVSYDRLRASAFVRFGSPIETPELGDTLIFKRPGGYHVGIYIAEDDHCYHVAGGNQGNQYSFCARIEKDRLYESRRPEYKTGTPASVKRYFVKPDGNISSNEA